jgi:2-keto-4-pentenoate hydratase
VTREALAAELLDGYVRAASLTLLSARPGGLTLDEAYRVADEVRRLRVERGERPLGYKIGFTNRTIWPRYGVYAPIWGPVWDTTTTQIAGTRADVSLAGLVQPRLEPEIVFGFARRPPPDADIDGLIACLDWVAHGFEIVHTHFVDWRFAAPDTVADFALHGRLLIGPRVPIGRLDDLQRALATLSMVLMKNGTEVDRGVGHVVLDGPVDALRVWVQAMHEETPNWSIEPGDIVTTGTITDAWPMAPGDHWESRPGDDRLAGLSLSCKP